MPGSVGAALPAGNSQHVAVDLAATGAANPDWSSSLHDYDHLSSSLRDCDRDPVAVAARAPAVAVVAADFGDDPGRASDHHSAVGSPAGVVAQTAAVHLGAVAHFCVGDLVADAA